MTEKNTKIVCTIGPSSWSPEMLEKLMLAGMDVARLNFSHGSYEEKGEQIKLIRKLAVKLNKSVAIMADMQGPKIRLGKIEGNATVEGIKDTKLFLEKGDKIKLSVVAKGDELPMQFDLSPYLKRGHRLLLNDGLVEVIVTAITGKVISGEVKNDGYISSNKGVNVPDTLLPGASLTQKDFDDSEFALKAGVDYLAISFVQSPVDLKKARELIKKYDPRVKLIVKFEKPQAIDHIDEIVRDTDVIMVARGDLGIETNATEVPLVQKKLIRLCRQYFKPVIVATQMLESMTENPRPTRAEISDVANAVFDQSDAVMLSGETANGKYPIEAVTVMRDTILSVEGHDEYNNFIGIDWDQVDRKELAVRSVASSGAWLADLSEAKVIVVASATGKTAQDLSSLRPEAKIVAVTHDEYHRNQMALMWGVTPYVVKPYKDVDQFWKEIMDLLREKKIVKKGERVVIISGVRIGESGNTDTIKMVVA